MDISASALTAQRLRMDCYKRKTLQNSNTTRTATGRTHTAGETVVFEPKTGQLFCIIFFRKHKTTTPEAGFYVSEIVEDQSLRSSWTMIRSIPDADEKWICKAPEM